MKLSPTGSYMEALDHARKFRRVQMVIGKDDHRYLVGLQHRHTERGVMVIDEKAYWKPEQPPGSTDILSNRSSESFAWSLSWTILCAQSARVG